MNPNYYHLIQQKEAYKKDNRTMFLAGIIGVLLAYFMITHPSFPVKLFTWNNLFSIYGFAFYTGASFIAGWKLLHNFTSKFFLFLPLLGWVIYFFLKIALSLFLGTYFYGIFRFINNLVQLNKLNKKCASL